MLTDPVDVRETAGNHSVEELVSLARGWWTLGRPKRALSKYAEVLRQEPGNLEALLAHARIGSAEAACEIYPKLVARGRLEALDYWRWFGSLMSLDRPRQAALVADSAALDARDWWSRAIAADLLLRVGRIASGVDVIKRILREEGEVGSMTDDVARLLAEDIYEVPADRWAATDLDRSVTLRECIDLLVGMKRPLTATYVIQKALEEEDYERANLCLEYIVEMQQDAEREWEPDKVPWTRTELHRWQAEVAEWFSCDYQLALEQWDAFARVTNKPNPFIDLRRADIALTLRHCARARELIDAAVASLEADETIVAEQRDQLTFASGLLLANTFYYEGRFRRAWRQARTTLAQANNMEALGPMLSTLARTLSVQFGLATGIDAVLDSFPPSRERRTEDRIRRLEFLRWAGEHSAVDDARRYRQWFDLERRDFLSVYSSDAAHVAVSAYVALLGGDGVEAARLLKNTPERRGDVRLKTLRAHADYLTGEYESALDAFRELAASRGQDVYARAMVVASLLALDRVDEAYGEADRLRKAVPGFVPGQALVAQCLERLCEQSDQVVGGIENAGRRAHIDTDMRAISYSLELVHRYRRVFQLSDARAELLDGKEPPAPVGSDSLTEDEVRFTAIRGIRAVIRAESGLRKAGLPFERGLHEAGEEFVRRLERAHPTEAKRFKHLIGRPPIRWPSWVRADLRPLLPLVAVAILIALLVTTSAWQTARVAFGVELTTLVVAFLAVAAIWPFAHKLTLPGGFGVEKLPTASAMDNAEIIRTTPIWQRSFVSSWMEFEQPNVPSANPEQFSDLPGAGTTDADRGVDEAIGRPTRPPQSEWEARRGASLWFPRSIPATRVPPPPESPLDVSYPVTG